MKHTQYTLRSKIDKIASRSNPEWLQVLDSGVLTQLYCDARGRMSQNQSQSVGFLTTSLAGNPSSKCKKATPTMNKMTSVPNINLVPTTSNYIISDQTHLLTVFIATKNFSVLFHWHTQHIRGFAVNLLLTAALHNVKSGSYICWQYGSVNEANPTEMTLVVYSPVSISKEQLPAWCWP